MIVFLNGDYFPKSEARISPDDRGFLLADGVYEVTRCYNGFSLALDQHITRLKRSLKELCIPDPQVDFEAVSHELLKRNHLDSANALVYLQVTRGVSPRVHAFPKGDITPTVYGFATAFDIDPEDVERGVKVITVPDMRWMRCDIKSVALLPNVLAQQRAREAGAEEAIFIRNGAVTEGAHTNVCGVFDGVLYTHPESNLILPGITRRIALDLCEELDIPVQMFPILESKLRELDELMILGTGSDILPVVQIDDWQVGNGQPGPITRRLIEAFQKRCTHA